MEAKKPLFSRKRFLGFLLGSSVLLTGVGLYHRLTGYPALSWQGKVLKPWEAAVLIAGMEVVLPSLSFQMSLTVAENVDRFLTSFLPSQLGEIHALFFAIEHLTFLSFYPQRLSRLSLEQRDRVLQNLANSSGPLKLCYQAFRDFCFLGYYQDPSTWKNLHYLGPLIQRIPPKTFSYRDLLATTQHPKALVAS